MRGQRRNQERERERERERLMEYCRHLETVIGPTTELHDAGLFVKGEIFYIDFATGFVDGRRPPFDQAVVVDGGFGRQRHLEVSIGATHTHTHAHTRARARAATHTRTVLGNSNNNNGIIVIYRRRRRIFPQTWREESRPAKEEEEEEENGGQTNENRKEKGTDKEPSPSTAHWFGNGMKIYFKKKVK